MNYYFRKIRWNWHKLWIRVNEFHSSLNFDAELYFEMSPKERDFYDKDLMRRRWIAHKTL